MAEFYLRKARVQDVKTIHGLLMTCSEDRLLLPRSFSALYSHLRDFNVVAERSEGGGPDVVVGCCALAITWEDIAEIRSLAVASTAQKRGLGRQLVEACLSEAVTLGIYRVFTLTYQVAFFERFGFEVVEKDVLPQKVWADCVHCPKFPECDETAMLLEM